MTRGKIYDKSILVKQKFLNLIIPFLAHLLIKLLYNTLKIKVIGEENIRQLKQEGKTLIYAFWHGRQFLLVPYMSHRQIVIMVSLSRDGEYQSKILKKFGCRIFRGSTTRGGTRALLELIKQTKQGDDFGFAVDGPTGPIYEPKEGIISLAKKKKAYIVPLTTAVKKKWILEKAWDKFQIPYPFTQGIIIFGKPYQISEKKDVSEESQILKQKLNAITEQADEFW
ncbi:MAG: lysophospholipid acyltransferase family protein [bacterium]